MRFSLSSLFSSSARTAILELLGAGRAEFSVREVADIVGINSKTALEALRSLVSMGVLSKRSRGRETNYRLNDKSQSGSFVRTIIKASRASFSTKRTMNLQFRAEETLSFLDDARGFFTRHRL